MKEEPGIDKEYNPPNLKDFGTPYELNFPNSMTDLGFLPTSGNLNDELMSLGWYNSTDLNLVHDEHDLLTLCEKVKQWHYARNLIEGSTDKDQTLKLLQELGELSDNVCKGKDIRDDIGDMLVVMLNITERNQISLADCLQRAWDEIKDRKGKMVDGIFVKEEDLQ